MGWKDVYLRFRRPGADADDSGSGGSRPRRSQPGHRPLTPYQARLDVEMDDTAISKVRDPSVSFLVSRRPGARSRRRPGPLASLALGALGGVAAVVVISLVARACSG